MTDYRSVADAVAAEIASGQIGPGHRLPPQRTFAYERGIAVSTAARVYTELARRGLTLGEVGRGTYVRSDLSGPVLQPEPAPGARCAPGAPVVTARATSLLCAKFILAARTMHLT